MIEPHVVPYPQGIAMLIRIAAVALAWAIIATIVHLA